MRSSKNHPCPICDRTKDGDCVVDQLSEGGRKIRCHTWIDQDANKAGWTYKGATTDGMWGIYLEGVEAKHDTPKPLRPASKVEYIYRDANGEPVLKVLRIDDGKGSKACPQYSWNGTEWVKGIVLGTSQNIHLYRVFEASSNADAPLFITEGEGKADLLIEMGLNATTAPGGAGKWHKYGHENYLTDLEPFQTIVLCPDRDTKGVAHMDAIASELAQTGKTIRWLYAFPNSPLWANLPSKNGLDVADWVKDYELSAHDILSAVEDERRSHGEPLKSSDSDGDIAPSSEVDVVSGKPVQLTFYQQVWRDLYLESDTYWICVEGKLYRWAGTHYTATPEEEQIARIWKYCNSYKVETKDSITYPYASPKFVTGALTWVKASFSLSPDRINPPGLNCINGVLELRWQGSTPSWDLVPHDPKKHYFIYEPYAKYDPDADSSMCDRLLKCLDRGQLEVFLRNVAASLDLRRVRKFKGRTIRALFLKGEGSNGKDTLREVVSMLFGYDGIASCTLNDFAAYDNGRKFTLYKARHARIIWSSENQVNFQIDRTQSLKAFITGDKISFEGKGKDEQESDPNAILLFNCNDTPNFTGALEAIKSRFAVLTFNRVFKEGADPKKGEIEADPRFKYDTKFIQDDILPAFLNRLLEALQNLMKEGINYDATNKTMEAIKAETNHLYMFCKDVGLTYNPDGKVYINEIWQKLEDWYQSNGTLVIEDKKRTWYDQARTNDKNVKSANQVLARFIALFPKAKRGGRDSTGVWINGLEFGEITSSQMSLECDSLEEELTATTEATETTQNCHTATQTQLNQGKERSHCYTNGSQSATQLPSTATLTATSNGHHPPPDRPLVVPDHFISSGDDWEDVDDDE